MSHIPDAPLLDPETVARIERENTTVGQYERLAGLGQTHEERRDSGCSSSTRTATSASDSR